MIVGPWVFGALAGFAFGRVRFGLIAAIGLGLVLTAAGLFGFFITAPASPGEACYECSEYFGRWLDYTMVEEWPIWTALSWSIAAVLGWARANPRSPYGSTEKSR